jgi:hypothetical protein
MHEQIVRETEINRLRQVRISQRSLGGLEAGRETEKGVDANEKLH